MVINSEQCLVNLYTPGLKLVYGLCQVVAIFPRPTLVFITRARGWDGLARVKLLEQFCWTGPACLESPCRNTFFIKQVVTAQPVSFCLTDIERSSSILQELAIELCLEQV
jgi:hypothetical protein